MSAVTTPTPEIEIQPQFNRRNAVRVPFGIQVTVSFKGTELWTEADAALIEISASGMQVRCDRRPRGDQTVMIGFLWHGHGLCAAVGTPVRYERWGSFGVCFTRINYTLRSLLTHLEEASDRERSQVFADIADAQVWIE